MRASAIIVAIASLVVAATALDVNAQPEAMERRQAPSDDGFEFYRRQLMQAASPTPIAKRQGLGGGAGGNDEVTTATGVQTISGYDPPPSSQIPDPTVSSGKIIATGDIPGFNSSSGGSNALGSSPADALRQPAHVIIAAVGGVAAGAAYILF